ncbi:MAG: hypothetical protein GQF41_3707 [Candidatus Rifleibacterium amylolyticum]|nr:MAG: hypothetical protein GQF41_3707 [Candidatus Rifleibacterium amylolyticum]NLF95616.1 hypothetical protein [Candidatus Riflebacteria bacterium]
MATDKVSGYQPRPVEYSREQETRTAERPREEPARPTPEQARADSIARKPKPAVKTLGSRIDVYA